MKKIELELELRALRNEVLTLKRDLGNLYDIFDKQKNELLTIDASQMRDYIVRTKYIGTIKDKNIINDFKTKIKEQLKEDFEKSCEKILNYNFHNAGIYILGEFYWQLKMFEEKQEIVNTYGTKA